MRTIQISRSQYTESSRRVAILRLNEYEFHKGEVVMVKYTKEVPDFRGTIGIIVALGIGDGIGEEYYRVLTVGNEVTVTGITELLPDVSVLIHGERYITKVNGVWNYVYINETGTERVIEEITETESITFVDLGTGYRWFYNNGSLKREDDFFNQNFVEDTVEFLIKYSNLEVNVAPTDGVYLYSARTLTNVPLSITVTTRDGEDVTNEVVLTHNDTVIEGNTWTIENISETQEITIKASHTLPGTTFKAVSEGSCTIWFGDYIYYGLVEEGDLDDWSNPTESLLGNLEKSLCVKDRNFTWEHKDLTNQAVVFATPKYFGNLLHILDDNSMDYIDDYICSEIYFEEQGLYYYVYVKKAAVSINDFKQELVFVDINDPDYINSFSKLDANALIEAWEGKNEAGGLLVLNDRGKIDKTLLDETTGIDGDDIILYLDGGFVNSSSAIPTGSTKKFWIKDINKYYNGSYITDPIIKAQIYYIDTQLFQWNGTALAMIVGFDTNVITNINEIL